MAYTPLNTADIAAGKPTKEEIFDTIKTNQDCFNDEITLLQGTAKLDIFDVHYGGSIDEASQAELDATTPIFKAPVAGTFVSFVVTLLEASTSGTLGVEIEKSTDNGINWTPLLTSPVTVTGTTVGSISGTVNWVDVPSQAFAQNELFRIIVDTVQVDQGRFHVSVYGELS